MKSKKFLNFEEFFIFLKILLPFPLFFVVYSENYINRERRFFYEKNYFLYTNGNVYHDKINVITKFSQNSSAGITKFIVNYKSANETGGTKEYRGYTIATFDGEDFVVSNDVNDIFKVYMPYKQENNFYPDIYYHKDFGFFIPVWHTVPNGSQNYLCKNYLFKVDIEEIRDKTRNQILVLESDSYKKMNVFGNRNVDGSLNIRFLTYEMESVSMIEHDEQGGDDYKIVFSCNRMDLNNVGCDSVEVINNSSSLLN